MALRLEDIRDPKQRAMFAKAAGVATPLIVAPAPKKVSSLEESFVELWARCQGPELKREVGLIPGRLFRVDFLHEESKTVVEIEGFGPGHVGKAGFKKDAGKYFTLQVDLGYSVIRLTKHLITEENVRKIIGKISV